MGVNYLPILYLITLSSFMLFILKTIGYTTFFLPHPHIAGHYVPVTAQVIVESNSVFAQNLKGIAIGNGWVDPKAQYGAYGPYALMENIIDQSTADRAKELYATCRKLIDNKDWHTAFTECEMIVEYVITAAEKKLGRSINVYDIRKECKPPPLCYDMTNLTHFLNRRDVQEDLGVDRTWKTCSSIVEEMLIGDWVHDFQNATATVMDKGRRAMVYSGKEDYICNYLGGMEWTNSTQWHGRVIQIFDV